MAGLRFDWDDAKAARNVQKHGVSFEEARTVFSDDDALLIQDPEHSQEEDRFLLLGASSGLRLLMVVHCYRGANEGVRIISARRASRPERRQYQMRFR